MTLSSEDTLISPSYSAFRKPSSRTSILLELLLISLDSAKSQTSRRPCAIYETIVSAETLGTLHKR